MADFEQHFDPMSRFRSLHLRVSDQELVRMHRAQLDMLAAGTFLIEQALEGGWEGEQLEMVQDALFLLSAARAGKTDGPLILPSGTPAR